jgi:hypothetical protein
MAIKVKRLSTPFTRVIRLTCAVTLMACGSAFGFSYSAYDIGLFGGFGFDTSMTGQSNMSPAGHVLVNVGSTSQPIHYFLTGPDGVGETDLGPYGSSGFGGIFVAGVNASGRVAGGTTGFGANSAFISGPDGAGRTPIFSGASPLIVNGQTLVVGNSNVTGINSLGQVIGGVQVGNGNRGFITGPNGIGASLLSMTTTDAGGQSVSTALSPWLINNAGHVVSSILVPGPVHLFLTDGDGANAHDLGSMTFAAAMNASGQVLGVSGNQWVLTGPGGTGETVLGAISGAEFHGLNDAGQVVGRVGSRAVISDMNGSGFVDLSGLAPLANGQVFINAYSINNSGQILAKTTTGIFVLTPVPEPETQAMLIAGLAIIGGIARRRRATTERKIGS